MRLRKQQKSLLPELPAHLDKAGFPLYRHLLPRKSYKGLLIAFCVGLVIFVLASCGAFILVTALAGSVDEGDGFLSAMIMFAVMFGVLILLSCGAMIALYRSEMRKYAKRWAIMNMLGVEEIIALQEEIAKARLWFGTFHLLTHYLYAPKQKVIIYYGDLAGWKRTIQSGIHLEITEQDGTLWQVHVNNWRVFRQEENEFMNMLRNHVARCGGSL